MRWIHFEQPDDVYGWESDADFAIAGQVHGEWFGIEGTTAEDEIFDDAQTRFMAYLMVSDNWERNPEVHSGTFTKKQEEQLRGATGRRSKPAASRKGFGLPADKHQRR